MLSLIISILTTSASAVPIGEVKGLLSFMARFSQQQYAAEDAVKKWLEMQKIVRFYKREEVRERKSAIYITLKEKNILITQDREEKYAKALENRAIYACFKSCKRACLQEKNGLERYFKCHLEILNTQNIVTNEKFNKQMAWRGMDHYSLGKLISDNLISRNPL